MIGAKRSISMGSGKKVSVYPIYCIAKDIDGQEFARRTKICMKSASSAQEYCDRLNSKHRYGKTMRFVFKEESFVLFKDVKEISSCENEEDILFS